jgi:hypothetical protein
MSSQSYDLYGSKRMSIAHLRDAISNALGITFTLHDSAFRGGTYFRVGDFGGEEFVIQQNIFEFDNEEEIAEPEFAHYPVIFWIAWTERGDEFREKLTAAEGLDFLRRRSR